MCFMHLKMLFLGMVHRLMIIRLLKGPWYIQMPVVGDQEEGAEIWKMGNFGVCHQLTQKSFKIS